MNLRIFTFIFISGIVLLNRPLLTAQHVAKYRKLNIGDTIPEYIFKHVINNSGRVTRLSDFRGKFLILDFWGTGCASCVESFPKLMHLQKEFNNEIQILLINPWEREDLVSRVLAKRKKLTGIDITLPVACDDTTILQLFPVNGVPHIVWIDPQGIVRSVTYSDMVNSDNIKAFLKNKNMPMRQKVDKTFEMDFKKPLFINNNGGTGELLLWQSTLSKFMDGMLPSLALLADSESGYSIYITGAVETLYRFAYSTRTDMYDMNLTAFKSNRTIFNVNDKTKYSERINGIEQIQNFFAYQLISGKPVTREQLQEMMQGDLRRYFGMEVHWEVRTVKCLVLTASDTTLIKYQQGKRECRFSDVEFEVNGMTITQTIKALEDRRASYTKYPIIDETNFKGEIGNINIEGIEVNNYVELDKALQKFKMRLKLEMRPIETLVITEAGFEY